MTDFDLNKACFIVTGGSGGLGTALFKVLSQTYPKARLVNVGRTALENEIGDRTEHWVVDLTTPEAVSVLESHLKRIDNQYFVVFIHNAAITRFENLESDKTESSKENIKKLYNLNLNAVIDADRIILPLIKNRGGKIVYILSTLALLPSPFQAHYGASKAALSQYALALSGEAENKESFYCVYPGTLESDFFIKNNVSRSAQNALSMTCTQAAGMIVRGIQKNRQVEIIGWKNKILVFVLRLLPLTWQRNLAVKSMRP